MVPMSGIPCEARHRNEKSWKTGYGDMGGTAGGADARRRCRRGEDYRAVGAKWLNYRFTISMQAMLE
jgi:hypothetical protein